MTTVVVAEDEAIVRRDLVEMLSDEQFEVVGETGRGDEAIELVQRLSPDLVILDVKMPGMDGVKAAAAMTTSVRTAVLILTAFSSRGIIEEARDAGAVGFLVKPFRKEELVPAIEAALGRVAEAQALDAEFAALADDDAGGAERLETRRAVDRAKGELMDHHEMAERDAFAFIARSARERGTSLHEAARSIADGVVSP